MHRLLSLIWKAFCLTMSFLWYIGDWVDYFTIMCQKNKLMMSTKIFSSHAYNALFISLMVHCSIKSWLSYLRTKDLKSSKSDIVLRRGRPRPASSLQLSQCSRSWTSTNNTVMDRDRVYGELPDWVKVQAFRWVKCCNEVQKHLSIQIHHRPKQLSLLFLDSTVEWKY